jgi:4-phytase/acid phosphatase
MMGWNFSASQTTKQVVASGSSKEHLKLVVILSRHGVRSPTWTQDRLDAYSAQPWPKWSVPPGNLTSRGFALMQQFGSYDRAALAATGLLDARGCADASKTYLWADTDQRTLESGRALAKGLYPDCPPAIHSLAAGQNDPLFHPHTKIHPPAHTNAVPISSETKAAPPRDPQLDELLVEMQHVLLGCDPKIACTPAHAPVTLLLGAPATAAARSAGDRMVELQDPLAQASSFAEDLLLEYADGMPMDQVGWGKVDESQLRNFLELHTANFERTHRAPALARLEASNLLSHIARTMEQAVERKPVANAIGSPNAKLVLLVGHDTNIAGVAALLGLHWSLDGREDDTPPGTQLAFELWQNDRGTYFVRVTVAMQTLCQMREMQPLTPASPPARETLTLPECTANGGNCSWQRFHRIMEQSIDKSDVLPASAN